MNYSWYALMNFYDTCFIWTSCWQSSCGYDVNIFDSNARCTVYSNLFNVLNIQWIKYEQRKKIYFKNPNN